MIRDLLRLCRKTLYSAGHVQAFGLHVDFLLHLAAAFLLAFALSRWFNSKKTSLLILVSIAVKELVDIFAKSRITYIRPPELDSAIDVIAGVAGLYLGLAFAARFSIKRNPKNG